MPTKEFTGNCPIRLHTADGVCVGRCWYGTYGNICRSHGDVSNAMATFTLMGKLTNDKFAPKEKQ